MPKDISNLPMLMQKVIDLGEIDRWLRGIADIVPQAGQGGSSSLSADFNRHSIVFSPDSNIHTDDIESMQGFRYLLTACSRNNVSVQLREIGRNSLEIAFDPERKFSTSQVFGTTYANILPVLFGHRK